jgi:hypothetical protein
MHRNIKLLAVLLALLGSMCTVYDQSGAIVAPNGLSCQNRTNYDNSIEGQVSADCYYLCPDGTGRQLEIEGEFTVSSSLYDASKEEVDAQFCQGSLLPTPTPSASTDSPPTSQATEPALPSPTFSIAGSALLQGEVTMCDTGIRLINFRMLAPAPDLVVEGLEVQIADQPTTCSVNPTNPSVLTCNLPATVTFPARILVRLDGAVANDFIYDGLGCAQIATAFPTTTP